MVSSVWSGEGCGPFADQVIQTTTDFYTNPGSQKSQQYLDSHRGLDDQDDTALSTLANTTTTAFVRIWTRRSALLKKCSH